MYATSNMFNKFDKIKFSSEPNTPKNIHNNIPQLKYPYVYGTRT